MGVSGQSSIDNRQSSVLSDSHCHLQMAGQDAAALYEKLEHGIIPLFYANRDRFIDVMRHAISLNGSFFNTQRMIQQYVVKAYLE